MTDEKVKAIGDSPKPPKGSKSKATGKGAGTTDGSDFFGIPMDDAGVSDELAAGIADSEAQVVAIHRRSDAQEASRRALRRDIPDIVARAKAMKREQLISFKEVKTSAQGIVQALNTDINILDAFEHLFGCDGPYFDTFRGRTIGWNNQIIDDDFDVSPLLNALIVFGIPSPSLVPVLKLLKAFARKRRRNSLIERMAAMHRTWDRKERLETSLFSMFNSYDTPLNREFSKYFWLSLYNRIHNPGCYAPMVLSLFGTQGAGKSFFSKIISEEVIGERDIETATLDFSLETNTFLRKITGKAVIANAAEMIGFNKADLQKVKNFVTRTSDVMDYKFENDNNQLRQWVIVLDGNNYEGLQRDDTGNRRFYPMFINQREWRKGDPKCWDEDDFQIDYSSFREDFWQIMAECQEWFESRAGSAKEDWRLLVDGVMFQVQAFSRDEMANDRGQVKDDDLTVHLNNALREVLPAFRLPTDDAGKSKGRPRKKFGAFVETSVILASLTRISRNSLRVNHSHLKTKLSAAPYNAVQEIVNNSRGYLFQDVNDDSQWDAMVGLGEESEKLVVYAGKNGQKKVSNDQEF